MKYPWFPFYGNDFLVSTIGLTCEQVGIYIRLLCIQWDNGGLPNDPEKLAMMAGSHGLATAVPVHLFGLCQDGLLRNHRLEEIREEKIAYSQKQSQNGKGRWKNHATAKPPLNDGIATAKPEGMPKPCPSLSQSHSERESVVPPMSQEQYYKEFSTRPWTKDFLDYWWNELDGVCHWKPKNCEFPLDRKGVGSWLANRWPKWQVLQASGNGRNQVAITIQRTKRRDILAAKVKRLEGELQYDFERERSPDKVKELEESKVELSKLETEILHDT